MIAAADFELLGLCNENYYCLYSFGIVVRKCTEKIRQISRNFEKVCYKLSKYEIVLKSMQQYKVVESVHKVIKVCKMLQKYEKLS